MASDIFLKIDKIEGESQDSKHAKEIDIQSWSWGMHQPASNQAGTGGGLGQVEVHDLRCTKTIDKSSPILQKFCMSGDHIATVTLTSRKAGGADRVEFVVITLSEVMVSSISIGHANGNDSPTEEITLNFGKVLFEYTPQDTKSGSAQPKIPNGYDARQRILF